MKKKIVIFLIVGGIVGVGVYYLRSYQKTNIRQTLSGRAEEYIKKQQKLGSGEWSRLSLKNEEAPKAGETYVTKNCFSLQIPFPVTSVKEKSGCGRIYWLERPKGSVRVFRMKSNAATIEEDPAVRSRSLNKTEYKEGQLTANKKTFIVFKKTLSGFEKAAFYLEGQELIAITLIANTSENLDKSFSNMLNSFKIL